MTTELTLDTLKTTLSDAFTAIETTAHSIPMNVTKDLWQIDEQADLSVATEVNGLMNELLAYSTIETRLTDKYISIASRLLYGEKWKALKGIKSCNKAIEKVLGSGKKSTISGAIAIADLFYENGLLKDTRYINSSKQCMQKVAQANEKSYFEELKKWFSENPNCTVKAMTDKIDELKNPPVESTANEVDVEEKKADSKEESKAGSKEESKETPKEESKETPKEESKEKLSSNAHYQLTQLRAHIDSLTKEQIKKVIDDILALG